MMKRFERKAIVIALAFDLGPSWHGRGNSKDLECKTGLEWHERSHHNVKNCPC
jgi:hypothetical protein